MYSKLFFIALVSVLPFFSGSLTYAETVSGGGYIIEQIISPVQGVLSGNGYVVQSGGQVVSGLVTGGGYNLFSVFGTSTQVVTPPSPPSGGGGSSFSGGGGYFVFPPQIASTTPPSNASTTSLPSSEVPVTIPGKSTCSTRVVFGRAIDIGVDNDVEDVKKLERFLNEYENEKLSINGVYESKDIEAVKRWQQKYRSFILDPMRLKNPTGTIYTLSQRQIERQTTKVCGEPIMVLSCPFFRTNVSYGSRGEAVKNVQQFLNVVQGERLPLSGVFGPLTKDAVKRFQKSRKIYVTTYVPISIATGNWYTTTRIKANETIGCDILK